MALAEIGLGLKVGGMVLGAVGSVLGGKAKKKAAKAAAAREREDAKFREEAHRRDTARLISAQAAAAGASGLAIEGSPLLVMAETAQLGERDALHIRRGGQLNAAALKAEGSAAAIGGYLDAGAKLLSGGSTLAGLF